MAKKRKIKSRTRRRSGGRRRVSGMGGVNLETAAMALAGGLGGRVITNVTKNIKAINSKPIIRVALKGGAAYWMMSQKSPTLNSLALGLLGETALDAAGILAPNVFKGLAADNMSGIGATVIDLDNVSGYDDNAVAGYEDLAVAGVV